MAIATLYEAAAQPLIFQENAVTDPFRKTTALDFLARTTAAATAPLILVVDRDGQGTMLPAMPNTVEGADRGDLA